MKIKFLIVLIMLIFVSLKAEIFSYDKVLKNSDGIKNFNKKEFQKAKEEFESNAIEHPNDARLHYNLGNSQYKNGDLEAAENSYQLALRDQDFKERSEALLNLGNVKFQKQKLNEAIKHYRDALIENPQNDNARYNYELAAKLMQRQQQQKQNQPQESDKKNEKKEKKKQQQQQQKEQQKEKEQKQELKRQQEKKDKEEAEKLLKALLQKEKEEMKKKKEKQKADKNKTGKYW